MIGETEASVAIAAGSAPATASAEARHQPGTAIASRGCAGNAARMVIANTYPASSVSGTATTRRKAAAVASAARHPADRTASRSRRRPQHDCHHRSASHVRGVEPAAALNIQAGEHATHHDRDKRNGPARSSSR